MPRFPAIDIVDIPGKGRGVIAREFIPQGTRIIAEKPVIKFSGCTSVGYMESVHKALSSTSKFEFFLSFPCMQGGDPILGRFKHFLPCESGDDNAHGLFATICRINHTCCSPLSGPNAIYCWREDLNREVLHALRDIAPMEEITVSYIACQIQKQDPPVYLRENFGFVCSCSGCRRSLQLRARSLTRVHNYNSFMGSFPTSVQRGQNPEKLLNVLQRNLLAICEEGYATELARGAHYGFRLCAMYGDAENAIVWETLSRDCDALIQGVDTEEYRNSQKWIRDPATFDLWKVHGLRKLAAPNPALRRYTPTLESLPKKYGYTSRNWSSLSIIAWACVGLCLAIFVWMFFTQ
ncbi:hypothetical protein R3P38DRAFT_3037765 [Favolaschia claudopus]|uniref:SET domain-containing protein n=1 Tax=Favolaschia claudopus TaxID=2862362 RepID=A0AAW0AC98_9AGAR